MVACTTTTCAGVSPPWNALEVVFAVEGHEEFRRLRALVHVLARTARDQRVLVAVGEEERRADGLELRAFERHARQRHDRADVRNLLRGVVAGLEHRDRAERLAGDCDTLGVDESEHPGVARAERSSTSRATKATSPGWLGRSAPLVPPGASLQESGNVGAATTYPARTQ